MAPEALAWRMLGPVPQLLGVGSPRRRLWQVSRQLWRPLMVAASQGQASLLLWRLELRPAQHLLAQALE